MPIDPDLAIGAALPDRTFSWSESDVLLYHLGLGATELRHTLESAGLEVLPSFGVVAPMFHETEPPPLDLPGCDITLAQVVHGAQQVEVGGPLPTSGTATLRTRISDVWDKGKAAVIWQEGVATDPDGTALWTVRSSIFVRGEGGWGGPRGESTSVETPDRSPDAEMTYDVTETQAMLYRLSGDRNPLHADPAFAQAAGFPAPILHGLCTYGIALRRLTETMLGADATRVRGFGARFAGVVFPGERLTIRGWETDAGIVGDVTVGEDQRPALADVLLTHV